MLMKLQEMNLSKDDKEAERVRPDCDVLNNSCPRVNQK